MKILEDAGWEKLEASPLAYTKKGFYLVDVKAVSPDSRVVEAYPHLLEQSKGYHLIEAKNTSVKLLSSSRDLREILTVAKLMGLL